MEKYVSRFNIPHKRWLIGPQIIPAVWQHHKPKHTATVTSSDARTRGPTTDGMACLSPSPHLSIMEQVWDYKRQKTRGGNKPTGDCGKLFKMLGTSYLSNISKTVLRCITAALKANGRNKTRFDVDFSVCCSFLWGKLRRRKKTIFLTIFLKASSFSFQSLQPLKLPAHNHTASTNRPHIVKCVSNAMLCLHRTMTDIATPAMAAKQTVAYAKTRVCGVEIRRTAAQQQEQWRQKNKFHLPWEVLRVASVGVELISR